LGGYGDAGRMVRGKALTLKEIILEKHMAG
jgi:hypothetical protein